MFSLYQIKNPIYSLFQKSGDWKYQQTVDKALDYIADNIEAIDDAYSQAIATYALQLADHPQKHEALDSLLGKSISKG